MGISLGLGTLLAGVVGAGASAASAAHTQAANASAQSQLNKETMSFNRTEAKKARDWQAAQSVIDRQFNSAEALKQRQFAASEAATARSFDAQQSLLARQFEERMSSSAHQREVADLQAAGLNPILSATGGNGASTPSAPVIGAPLPTSSAASHSGSGGAQASIGALNAYMKKDVVGEFVNSALESVRVHNDLKRAEAEDKKANALLKEAETHAKEAVQRIEESISRVGLNYDEHELNQIRKLSEEERVKLVKEQITSEIVKRQDGHKLSEAQARAVEKSANAYAGLAGAQANLAFIRGRLETEKNPAVINELTKKAEEYQSKIDYNKWIMSDPKTLNERAFHEANPSNAGVEFASEVIGNVVHGAISFGAHSVTKGR